MPSVTRPWPAQAPGNTDRPCDPVFTVSDLSVFYGDYEAVRDVD